MQTGCALLSRTRLAMLAIASLGTFAPILDVAQPPPALQITVDDPRPLASAIEALEKRYGWIVTYEDPPYLHADDLADITNLVMKQHDPAKPRLLVPRGGAFTFSPPLPAGGRAQDASDTVAALLDDYHASGHAGVFRLVRAGGVLHVVPSMTRGAGGELEPCRPILDTMISFPSEERTAMGMVEAIRGAIQDATGVRIMIGTVPMNVFYNVRVTGGADNETTRSVLRLTLQATGWRLSWRLFREGGADGVQALNIHAAAPGGRPE